MLLCSQIENAYSVPITPTKFASKVKTQGRRVMSPYTTLPI